MKKIITAAVLGTGSRGQLFTYGLKKRQNQFKIVALCDYNPEQLKKVHTLYGLENTEDFYDENEFFKKKRADFLIIATHDRYHVSQCVKAMELGYDVFMEKPISDSREEIKLLLATQEKTGKKVIICHELRYGAGFVKCDELIKNGAIGKLYAIDASERAAYWHWAQAYVRGLGTLDDVSICHPVILAKCSHDLDLLQAYAGSECESVSSVGSRSFFVKSNKPEGAADKCVDCKYIDSCPYSAKRIYVDMWHENGEPEFLWPYYKVCIDPPLTEEKLMKGIDTSIFGQCVFNFEHKDFVDHQFVQMHFKNGVDASLKMVFGAEPGRRIVFYGSYGEIVLDERTDDIEIMKYGEKKQVIRIGTLIEGGYGHGGGDEKIMDEMYPILTNETAPRTTLKESVESHLMGIAAEESRKENGTVKFVH